MNYQKIHDSIIDRAKKREIECPIEGYKETHHIIPKSMGGNNDHDNLVDLTAKEHFIIHHLLWKIHQNRQMSKAYHRMVYGKKNSCEKYYRVTSRQFESARIAHSEQQKGNTYNLGNPSSEEKKKKISDANKGRKHTNETKQTLSRCNTGKKLSPETKKKISESLKGNDYALGYKHSEATRLKVTETLKGNKNALGYKHTPESKAKMTIAKKGNKNALGKKKSPETIEKLKKSMLGKTPWNKGGTLTDAHKNKISKSGKGRKHSPETIEKIRKSKTPEHNQKNTEGQLKYVEIIREVQKEHNCGYHEARRIYKDSKCTGQ